MSVKLIQTIPLFIFFTGLSSLLTGQVYINEVCTSNENSFIDSEGETPDWIELYNAGSESVSLQGWWLSDNENDAFKWQFPELNIAPDSYLILLASGEVENNSPEIHLNFKLSRSGEAIQLSDPSGISQHQVFVPSLPTDITYSRNSAGNFLTTSQASPGAVNDLSSAIGRSDLPVFSVESARQSNPFLLDLECDDPACYIRYTLDGSEPTDESLLFIEEIEIEETTPVRAKTFAPGLLPSETVTRNYFFSPVHDLPVLALSTTGDFLFDSEDGIFELGPDAEDTYPFYGANFWKDTEIPVHVEYLSGDFERITDFDLGARTHGGRGTRTKAQKALRLLAEHKYGDTKMDFKFFPEKDINSFERIVLRNGGGDFNNAHCRDEFSARFLLRENLNLDASAYQPVAWYINGEYYGIIALREKVDEFWIQENYGITEFDLLEDDSFVVNGNREIFEEDYAFILDNDLSQTAAYNQAKQRFDVENMVDYWVAQTAILNANWPHNNLKLWRERSDEGIWRYLLFDMDVSMERHPWTAAEINLLKDRLDEPQPGPHHTIMRSFLENPEFKRYFINRYADLLNTTFHPEYWKTAVDEIEAELDSEMQRHFARWSGCEDCNSYNYWKETAMPEMRDFCDSRPGLARDYVQDYFNLEKQVELTLKTYPEGAGTIKINTITPENLPWEGWYFKGVAVDLEIISAEGFEFKGWQSLRKLETLVSESGIQVDFEESDEITAYFEAPYQGLNPQLSPNPAGEEIVLDYELNSSTEISVEVYADDGRLLFPVYEGTQGGGFQRLSINTANLAAGMYLCRIKTDRSIRNLKFIRL